jgi:hypothetical protein
MVRLPGLFLIGLLACGSHTGDSTPVEESAPGETHATGPTFVDASTSSCGASGLPDCPLQGWMKANALRAMSAGDLPRLETAFDRIASFEVSGYPEWKSIAASGKRAAVEGDLEGARRACKQCHDAYRAKYREARRAQPLR